MFFILLLFYVYNKNARLSLWKITVRIFLLLQKNCGKSFVTLNSTGRNSCLIDLEALC